MLVAVRRQGPASPEIGLPEVLTCGSGKRLSASIWQRSSAPGRRICRPKELGAPAAVGDEAARAAALVAVSVSNYPGSIGVG